MREVLKYFSGGVIVYLVMAACSASNTTGRGQRATNEMDASTGNMMAGNDPTGGTTNTPGAGSGGTGQGNGGTMPGTGGFLVNPVPPAMAQTNGETITHSGVVDVACASVGTSTTTITQHNASDNSVASTTTITGTYYEAAITDAAVTLGGIRYAFVQMQGPPASAVSNGDYCSVYANTPTVTCTTQSTVPPTSAGAWMPNIGEGKISVSCGYLSETTTTITGQAPSTTTTDSRWQSAKFSYGTAS